MKRTFITAITIALLCFSTLTLAAPQKNLWPRWQINNPLSTKIINFNPWKLFLKNNVHTNTQGVNLVAYDGITSLDKNRLTSFLKYMTGIKIDLYNRKEQEAYWINLYNALTIATVLKHYPLKSILDIKISGWLKPGPWDAKLITVEGVPLSLNDIENRILRPIWNDQRIHYALNCASMSCPNLQKIPFTASNLNIMLNKAARDYINNHRGTEIKNNKLIVSSLYVWYKQDFGETDDAVVDFIKIYAKPKLRNELKHIKRITGNQYDWALNLWPDQKPNKPKNKKISKKTN